jgi:nucleoside-diphosphate-sugar epimerase
LRLYFAGAANHSSLMDILFIGGTGNISSACAERLFQQGHTIFVLTRGVTPVPREFRAIQADRKDPAALRQALGALRPQVVLNFLGYEPAEVETDVEVFRGVVKHYLFISSATVYAKPPPRLPITEDLPLGNPWWEYARKKQACEEWLLQRWKGEGFPVTIVRPSHTYSERWIPNPLSSSSYTFARRLEQGQPVFVPDAGENPWTLTASSDFALGLAGLIGQAPALGEAFHITSDEVLTWNQIVAEIAEALGVTSPRVVPVPTDIICRVAPQMTGSLKGDKSHPGVFDNSKLRRFVPQFQCRKPFRVGVRESVAWLRAHPDKQNLNPKMDALCDEVIQAWTNQRGTGTDTPPA